MTNNQRVNGAMDWFVTSRFFVRPVVAEYFRDPFQNFAHRWTGGVASGSRLVDTSGVSWEIKAGPAYQSTTFESVVEGESDHESTAALLAATTYTNEIGSAQSQTAQGKGESFGASYADLGVEQRALVEDLCRRAGAITRTYSLDGVRRNQLQGMRDALRRRAHVRLNPKSRQMLRHSR